MSFWAWYSGIVILWFWFIRCNIKTDNERQLLIDWIYDQPDWLERRVALDEVSYESHLFRRVLMLPWKHLYARWLT